MKKSYDSQKQRIQAALDASGLAYDAMAKRVGIKPESLRKAWKGYQGMSEAILRAIEGVAAESTVSPQKTRDRLTRVKHNPNNIRRVPIVSRAQAGELIQWEELLEDEYDFVSSDCPDPKAVALQVEGDSMEPAYKAGDVIIVMPSFKPTNESLVVVRLKNGDVMFKEMVFLDSVGEQFRLLSYNPRYPVREVNIDEIERAFPVYSVVRKVWDREKWQAQFDAQKDR